MSFSSFLAKIQLFAFYVISASVFIALLFAATDVIGPDTDTCDLLLLDRLIVVVGLVSGTLFFYFLFSYAESFLVEFKSDEGNDGDGHDYGKGC